MKNSPPHPAHSGHPLPRGGEGNSNATAPSFALRERVNRKPVWPCGCKIPWTVDSCPKRNVLCLGKSAEQFEWRKRTSPFFPDSNRGHKSSRQKRLDFFYFRRTGKDSIRKSGRAMT